MNYLIVFVGGGIGAALRHGCNVLFARTLGTAFPYATLFENVLGSAVMGILVALFAFKTDIPQHMRLFLTTGILGGYTTFSTWMVERTYIVSSIVAGVAVAAAGFALGSLL